MKTELIDKGDLSSQLIIVIEPEDYKSELETELKKYGQKAHLKGFRRGKTPITAIKKMYGKSVLVDVINKKLQQTIEDYIVSQKLDILGNPLPSDDQEMIDFDMKQFLPYEFHFDLGLAPELNIKGAGPADFYDKYKIIVEDKDIDEQVKDLQKRMGEQVEVVEPIQILDIITLEIIELESQNEEPFKGEITIMPDRMTQAYQEEFIGQEIGYKSEVAIFSFEKETSEEYVRKYFLKDAPENVSGRFATEVMTIKRVVPAEVNEEFFIKAFGEESEIRTEEACRAKLREDLEKFYESQGLSISKRKILESLVHDNEMNLPDAFLKRWLLATNENLDTAKIQEEYAGFAKNLRWTLIKNKLNEQYKIDVTVNDIKSAMIEKFKKQFAQYGYGMTGEIDFDAFADRMMENKEAVQKEYEEILAERIMDKVVSEVSFNDREINIEEYKAIVDQLKQNID